jgi:hypothetical protein
VTESKSIFSRYFSDEPFVDRHTREPGGAVDVIIPVLHTNELWAKNLTSIYREIPVNRLLLGNAGCVDDTLAVARKFPRVQIFDHTAYKSLGYSIKELIRSVETDWFIYLHSDVYLPDGWFDTMRAHQGQYDWFGCPMRITALVEYPVVNPNRPYAGSQMGRKAAFLPGLDRIDDDYVYRQEDFVFARLVEDANFRHGRIEDTFHYHQVMPRVYGSSQRARRLRSIEVHEDVAPEEQFITVDTQVRGIIKYLRPDAYQIGAVRENLWRLNKLGKLDLKTFRAWVEEVNPEWLPHIPWNIRAGRLRSLLPLMLEKLRHRLVT